jgi:hypothetical protein
VRALLIVVVLATAARADRSAHLERALAQLAATDPIALDRALYEAIRMRCKVPAATRCMIEIAREHCAARNCLAAADVIITNQHAERDLLDEQTRVRIVRTAADYHTGVLAELRTRYAILAAELALARPAPLAAQIDQLCATRDQIARRCAPDAPACLGTIAYQRCAAALVWFVSTEAKR